MGYLEFDKNQLVNLSYSLKKEFLRTNKNGAYASSTIIGCNTRKYHGLLVCPQSSIDDELHVLLSAVDISLSIEGIDFNLGVHRYPNDIYMPKGHKYIDELSIKPPVTLIYGVGGIRFSVTTVFSSSKNCVFLKYEVLSGDSEVLVKLKPYLAFRNRHQLSKANNDVNKNYKKIDNGVSFKLYQPYSDLNLQLSKSEFEYIHTPEWYYDIEYLKEKERGYDAYEDLLVPGYFEFKMKKSESVILSAGTEEVSSSNITKAYNKQLKKLNPLTDFKSTLENAADHFIRKHNGKYEIVAGLPWFGRWGRDTFISLPGLCLSRNQIPLFKSILNSFLKDSKENHFPNLGYGDEADYKSVDTSLWFFWTLQKFIEKTGDFDYLYKNYYKKMKSILRNYRNGSIDGIELKDNGLIWAEKEGQALTWMDAVVDGQAVTQRPGFAVEVNALWYNAIKFSLEIAQKFNDEKFISEWTEIADKIPAEFKSTFWSKHKGYLADYVYNDFQDWSVRPNMLFAASLKYSPVSEKIQQLILQAIKMDLLTIRGLRTLSPQNPNYKGECFGNQATRDSEYHQGTIWPWLLGHYVEANLKIFGKNAVSNLEWHLEHFEDVLMEHGIGTISEIYDGNPPHAARGAISQAWSVAEILRALELIESVNKQNSES